MGWKIEGNHITGAEVGVRVVASKGAEVTVSSNKIEAVKGKGVELLEAQSFVDALGLPSGLPVDEICELLMAIRQGNDHAKDRQDIIRRSRLWGRVENLANAATIMQTFSAMSLPVITTTLASLVQA